MEENNQDATGPAGNGRTGMERIDSFSDAVFAVAITLLILTIDVPEVAGEFADQQLPSALGDMYPRFFGYVLSFLIVGVFWMRHHELFRYIRKYDKRLIWLNHLFLMCVVFLPFTTELMSTYENSRWATGFYAVSLGLCSLVLAALWWYATFRHDLSAGSLPVGLNKDATYSALAATAVFLLSLALLPVSIPAAKYFWITLWPISAIIGRRYNPRPKKARRGEVKMGE